jgi:hypothetical protein
MPVYVAFDPGGTTGVAIYDSGDRRWERYQLDEDQHHVALWEDLNALRPDVVICESFEYRPRLPKAILISRNYIGIIELWCKLWEKPLHLQTAATGKGFWKDEKIRKLRLWKPGMPHANDATRHLLYHISFTEGDQHYLKRLR